MLNKHKHQDKHDWNHGQCVSLKTIKYTNKYVIFLNNTVIFRKHSFKAGMGKLFSDQESPPKAILVQCKIFQKLMHIYLERL